MFDLNTKVLVVDDMMTMRKLVAKVCKEVGFVDVMQASNGAEAWEIINNTKPLVGLVLSDWNMPQSSGIDLLKRVRSDSRFEKLPFLLITAEAEQHQVVEAAKAGVTEYIIKPFTADILKGKLESAYKRVVASLG